MTLDDIINDVSLEKTARVDYAYNDAGMAGSESILIPTSQSCLTC